MDRAWGQRASGQLVREDNMGRSGKAGAGETRGRRTASASRAAAEEQVVPSGHRPPLQRLLAHRAVDCCSCLSPTTPWGEHSRCSQPCGSICNATPCPHPFPIWPTPATLHLKRALPAPASPSPQAVTAPVGVAATLCTLSHAAHSLHRHPDTSRLSSAPA